MKRYLIAVCVLLAGSVPAGAFSAALTKQLKELSGTTRFVQACSLQALIEISKDKNGLRPTHAAVDALGAPHQGRYDEGKHRRRCAAATSGISFPSPA